MGTYWLLVSETPLKCGTERGEQCDDDGEDTSSSSQEYDDVGLREEKALSDSEIKVNVASHATGLPWHRNHVFL